MRKLLLALGIAALLLLSTGISQAGNVVYVEVGCDTIFAGFSYQFNISIENDVTLGGVALGFKLFSPDGATWTWGNPKVEIVSGSRMDGAFLPGSFNVVEYDTDGVLPDSLLIDGASQSGIEAGWKQHMLSLNGVAGPNTELIHTLCLDTAYIPSSGGFVFVDVNGLPFTPDFVYGGCWPVKALASCDAYFNENFGYLDLYH